MQCDEFPSPSWALNANRTLQWPGRAPIDVRPSGRGTVSLKSEDHIAGAGLSAFHQNATQKRVIDRCPIALTM
eukprot:5353893-Pyramimonas_sp.AAC.2